MGDTRSGGKERGRPDKNKNESNFLDFLPTEVFSFEWTQKENEI